MSKRDLIIDTNLLLLLVIGAIENGRHIKNSNRLKAFDEDDYQDILAVMQNFDTARITPYIATEVSNLIDLTGHAYLQAMETAREFFNLFKPLTRTLFKIAAQRNLHATGLPMPP